jgi:hypothetical protein
MQSPGKARMSALPGSAVRVVDRVFHTSLGRTRDDQDGTRNLSV